MGKCSWVSHSLLSATRRRPLTDTYYHTQFNLETPDTDFYRDSLRSYKNISQLDGTPPPLEVQVLLTVPELTNNQVLVQHPPNASRVRVQPTPSHVLLESWRLSFTPSNTSSGSQSSNTGSASIALPTVYKHAMSIFRSVYTLTRVLPTWRFSKRLRRPGPASRNGSLGIAIRVNVQGVDASTSADTRYLHFGAYDPCFHLILNPFSIYIYGCSRHPAIRKHDCSSNGDTRSRSRPASYGRIHLRGFISHCSALRDRHRRSLALIAISFSRRWAAVYTDTPTQRSARQRTRFGHRCRYSGEPPLTNQPTALAAFESA